MSSIRPEKLHAPVVPEGLKKTKAKEGKIEEVVFKNMKSLSDLSFKERFLHFIGYRKWVKLAQDKSKNTFVYVNEKWLLDTLNMKKSAELKPFKDKGTKLEIRMEALRTLFFRAQVNKLKECPEGDFLHHCGKIVHMLEVNNLGTKEFLQNLRFRVINDRAEVKLQQVEDFYLQFEIKKAYQAKDFAKLEKLLNYENIFKEGKEKFKEAVENYRVCIQAAQKDEKSQDITDLVIMMADLRGIIGEIIDCRKHAEGVLNLLLFKKECREKNMNFSLFCEIVSGKKAITSQNYDQMIYLLTHAPQEVVDEPSPKEANDEPFSILDDAKANLEKLKGESEKPEESDKKPKKPGVPASPLPRIAISEIEKSKSRLKPTIVEPKAEYTKSPLQAALYETMASKGAAEEKDEFDELLEAFKAGDLEPPVVSDEAAIALLNELEEENS